VPIASFKYYRMQELAIINGRVPEHFIMLLYIG
jgi:hypothetical protein